MRAVGTWGLAAGIVNVTVGGGIFRLPGEAAKMLGTSAPLAYLVCALAMGLIVLCFADAGSRVSLTGGPYAYVELAFGPFVGFLGGVLLWLLGTFAVAAVSTVFADSAGALVPALGAPLARGVFLVLVFAVLSAVNIRGVRQGTRLNTVATVAKLAPLLLLVVAGLFRIDPANLRGGPAPEGGLAPAVAAASVVLIFAFSGIESALVPSGEVRHPARAVPRAIGIAMAGITVLYLALHLVAQGTLGPGLATSGTPLADAAGVVLGPWGRTLILVGATVSMFGYVSGMTLAVPRALYAFGRDGILPRALASIHPSWHTPWVAILVQSVLVCALALSGTFARLAVIANVAALLLYAACCVAAWELRRRGVQSGGDVPFRVPGAAVVPWLALAVIAFMLRSVSQREWLVVLGVLGAAALVFFLGRAVRGRAGATT